METTKTEINKEFPIKLVKELDKYIVGNDQYKIVLSMAIRDQIFTNKTKSILVMGPTGSGKSYMIEVLEKCKTCPKVNYTIMTEAVDDLTEAGVQGKELSDIFKKYREKCKRENNDSFRGLIFIDEVDKLINPSYVSSGGSSEVYNRNAPIQHQLMKILNGQDIYGVPTKNILFVLAGAFYQIDEEVLKVSKHISIGFSTDKAKEDEIVRNESETVRDKLIKAGMQREFLGRINIIIRLKKLSEKELKTLILHPTRGEIAKVKKDFLTDGIDLDFTTDSINFLVKLAQEEDSGGRAVSNVLEQLLTDAKYMCFKNNYNKIIIDKETIEGKGIKYLKEESKKIEKKVVDKC